LSDLLEAMIMHIHHLVHEEQRSFSYLDFIKFEVDGQMYKMAHGTFRNNVSSLIKKGLIEVAYRSNIAFYTLKGIKSYKASRMTMTRDHTGVPASSLSSHPSSISSNPLYRIVKDLPLDKCSLHDIRLRFVSPRVYAIMSSSVSNNALGYDYTVNSRSKDIILPAWKIGDLLIKATIHRTDTVSIAIGCSLSPVGLDIVGIIRLTNALAVVQDRLSRIVKGFYAAKGSSRIHDSSSKSVDQDIKIGIIPPHSDWIVTMWHFGADASVEYTGEKFSVTWQTAEDALVRAYTKVINDNKTRIRLERQEYPKATLADIIEQKLSHERSFISV
jgi:hypothetical protein